MIDRFSGINSVGESQRMSRGLRAFCEYINGGNEDFIRGIRKKHVDLMSMESQQPNENIEKRANELKAHLEADKNKIIEGFNSLSDTDKKEFSRILNERRVALAIPETELDVFDRSVYPERAKDVNLVANLLGLSEVSSDSRDSIDL